MDDFSWDMFDGTPALPPVAAQSAPPQPAYHAGPAPQPVAAPAMPMAPAPAPPPVMVPMFGQVAPPPPISPLAVILGVTALVGTGLGAYHGYKRSGGDILPSLGWAFIGGFAPVISVPIMVAQGIGKPKSAT